MKNRKIKILFLVTLFFGLFLAGKNAHAATSYISPAAGSYEVGDLLTVNVLVNTESTAINNAEAVINFSKDLLEVVSVSKSGSIFSLWVEDPGFSNSAGSVSFNGGLPTPGYSGVAGKAIGIVFRVKAAGSASVVFSSCAIRANDGLGTNVFRGGANASFNLFKSAEAPSQPPVVPPVVPPEDEQPSDTTDTTEPEETDEAEETPEPEEVIANPFCLPAPIITDYPSELQPGDPFIAQGTILADLQVRIWLQFGDQEPASHRALRDQSGNFVYIHQTELAEGNYKLWADAVDSLGNHSDPTPQYDVLVRIPPKPTWWKISLATSDILSVVIPPLGLIFLFVLILLYAWLKMMRVYRQISHEADEAQAVLHAELDTIKKHLTAYINMLEKIKYSRPLTKEEEKMITKLGKDLDYIEVRVSKEIKDIQKKVK